MRLSKALLAVVLTIGIGLLIGGGVLAKIRSTVPTEGVAAGDPLYGSSADIQASEVGIQALQLIKWGGSDIKSLGGRSVRISGYTETYNPVEIISVDLYLQKWNGSAWMDISRAGPFKRTYASYVYGEKDLTVSSSGYYRTRAVHSAVDGSVSESISSYTGYIWVD